MNPKNNITFDTSAKLTQFLMKCIGLSLEAFTPELEKNRSRSWWKISQGTLFFLSYLLLFLTALVCLILGEAAYFRQSLINYKGFLDVTAVAPCIGFCFLSLIKMLTFGLASLQLAVSDGILAADCPFSLYTAHVCMHFRLLAQKMRTLTSKSEHRLLDLEDLRPCIEEHQKLIEIENIFSPSILVNFIGSSLMICLSGFQITESLIVIELITYIIFLTTSLLQIYTLCSYGNQLIDTSGEIAWAAYDSPWTDASMKYKKSLQFIILRAQRQQTYTAMKFSTVSFESFASVLKASFSYFTLLRTVFSKD
ncbi:putative odorant receptor 92a [Ctenocephalides felis]|uniref:putative odorant receptor 92a n=1 Tax=Ctenocephalides felis TaxID=7515 RepID=UPI000E6E21C7|nr:putative odorant receptor 92a [Ctenocephalides felis]